MAAAHLVVSHNRKLVYVRYSGAQWKGALIRIGALLNKRTLKTDLIRKGHSFDRAR